MDHEYVANSLALGENPVAFETKIELVEAK